MHVPGWPNTGVTKQSGRWLTAKCTTCDTTKHWAITKPPANARVDLERAGWKNIDRKWKTARCPECVRIAARAEQPALPQPKIPTDAAPFPASTPIPETTMTNTDLAAKAARRAVYKALETHYDSKALAYTKDWTDERIAKDAGCPVAVVTQIREAEYGPLEDSRIGDLRAEIVKSRGLAKQEAADLRAKASGIQAEIVASEKRWLDKIDALGKQVAALTGTTK
jgi:hypothetical protein